MRLAVEPIWQRIPETASRVRGRIENVLSWAIANRYREGPNPARWPDNLEHLLPAIGLISKVNHHAALAYDQLPEFWGSAQHSGRCGRTVIGIFDLDRRANR